MLPRSTRHLHTSGTAALSTRQNRKNDANIAPSSTGQSCSNVGPANGRHLIRISKSGLLRITPDSFQGAPPLILHQKIDKKFAASGGDLQLYAAEIRWAVADRLAIIDDPENQFILSPGIELELPTDDKEVFQSGGEGEWDLLVSAMKGISATGM